jgi:UDP-3-O-[3-hydroxymyristoyl] glucosamine N-acyltransferase
MESQKDPNLPRPGPRMDAGKDPTKQTTTLNNLAKLVEGTVSGDGSTVIGGAAILRDVSAGEITLADSSRHLKELSACNAAAVVVDKDFPECDRPRLIVDNVVAAFGKIVAHFCSVDHKPAGTIHHTAVIADDVILGEGVSIGPLVTIDQGCKIGSDVTIHAGVRILAGCTLADNVTLFPNVMLYERTEIGERSLLHAGCVLGAYGFGYTSGAEGHTISAQLGNVIVEADVEIGANTTIDRGTYGATRIGRGTKIDNLVMIAHNCKIGRHNMICSQVGIAGSCTTGDFVVMAGQVGVGDHRTIGDFSTLGAKAGVMHDIPPQSVYVGVPATPAKEQMQFHLHLKKVPTMRKELRELQDEVRLLQEKLTTQSNKAA